MRHFFPPIVLLLLGVLLAAGCAAPADKTVPKAESPPACRAGITDEEVVRTIEKAKDWLIEQQLAAKVELLPAKSPAVTDEDVKNAIEKAKEWLIKQQQEDGLWPEKPSEEAPGILGSSELVLYTLARLGEHPSQPAVAKALEAVMKRELDSTYAVSLRARALAIIQTRTQVPNRDAVHEALLRDVRWLVKAQGSHGGWNYKSLNGGAGRFDLSNTQAAIRALGDATRGGIEIPDMAWQRAQALYYKLQQADGSWNYGDPGDNEYGGGAPGYGSMTAAGVASLRILADMLDLNSGCPCRDGKSSPPRGELNRRMDVALAWLGREFKADDNPKRHGYQKLSWLCAVEEVALNEGYKHFGDHDWYREGAGFLLKSQRPDGSWDTDGDPLVSTCMAAQFLSGGRTFGVFQKLDIPNCAWNNHRRDFANLTSYCSKEMCGYPYCWEIVNLRASVEELHDAPILFISPETIPDFSADDKKKLREFTDTGGTILFEASCGNPAVRAWFLEFAREVWPEWPLTPLAADHGSFIDPYPLKQRPEILGIDDGVRTCVFYAMDDVSCPWQTKAIVAREYLFKWGINLFTYATDHAFWRTRLQTAIPDWRGDDKPRYTSDVKAGPKNTIRLVRMKYEGSGWMTNRNYKGFEKIAAELAKRAKITLKVDEDGAAATEIKSADALYLTGSKDFALAEAERAALKAYLAKGGFLWAEAAGGAGAFDEAFRKLAKDAGWELRSIEKNHPLMTGALKAAIGYNLTAGVQFRRALRIPRVGRQYADLVGIYQDGNLVGVYSPLDVVFSATPYEAYACKGYKPQDAAAVATNIVAFLTDRGR